MRAQILLNVHLAKTETALTASWPQLVASFLGRICRRHRLSLKALPKLCQDRIFLLLPEAHKVTRMCWAHLQLPLCTQGVVGLSLLLTDPGQHIPGPAQGSATPQPGPLVGEGGKGWGRCFTNLLICTETSEGEISSSAPWAGELSQRTVRADWNGRTKNSCFSTTRPRGKRLPTPPAAKSVLAELSHLGPTCRKGGCSPSFGPLPSRGSQWALFWGLSSLPKDKTRELGFVCSKNVSMVIREIS